MDPEQIKCIENLLDSKLAPMQKAIIDLEDQQKKIVDILMMQARQDESIKHMRLDVDKCVAIHDEVFDRIRHEEEAIGDLKTSVSVNTGIIHTNGKRINLIEVDNSNKTWDSLKMVIVALAILAVAIVGYLYRETPSNISPNTKIMGK